MVGERIKAARLAKGLSLRELANKVGVSHQAIHKYEVNQDMPSSRVLISLSGALGVKPEFFFRPVRPIEIVPAFRKHPKLAAKAEKEITASVLEWLERYVELESLVPAQESQGLSLPSEALSINSLDDVETLAEGLRSAWGLGTAPIGGLVELLEDRGVKVGVVDTPHDSFDACAFWVKPAGSHSELGNSPQTRLGLPIIAVRSGVPGDRQRFSLAHELGHLLLQLLGEAKSDLVDLEAAANRFAGAFIVPRQAAYQELGQRRRNVSLDEIRFLKTKYGFSMQAWLRRALELRIIPEDLEERLFRELKSQGGTKREPGEQVPPEEPTRMRRLALRAVAEGVITRSRADELVVTLP